jgi:hypothetical protein
MARSLVRALVCTAGIALLLTRAAHADCVDGVRAATPAEAAFHQRAMAAAAAALPKAAAPLERRDRVDLATIPPLSGLCAGTRVGGFPVKVAANYVRAFTPAEVDARKSSRRALEQQIEQLRTLPPDRQAEQDALNRKAVAVYESVPRRSREDPPFTPEQQRLVDQRTAEGRALEDKARRVSSDYAATVEPQVAPLRDQAYALDTSPQNFELTINVNAPEWDLRPGGDLRIASFGPMLMSPGAGLAVKQVAIVLRGPDGPAKDALFAAIDQEYLQRLLNAPLPATADSAERAARVAVATLPLEVTGSVAAGGRGEPAVATSAATAPATSSTKPKCAPPAGSGGSEASAAAGAPRGAEVGGSVIGGYGSRVGRTIGGALGALGSLGGSNRNTAAPSDCAP